MFGHYLDLALRSLKRNPVLTGLMIIAIGFGIGTSMTSLSVSRAMSGDPIPGKSQQLFMVQIDSWGPDQRGERNEVGLDENLSYIDAMAPEGLHAAQRQTRIYSTYFNVRLADSKFKPVGVIVPAVDSDFFPMFSAPLQFGGAWSRSDDQEGDPVVVISRKLNDQFFADANSIGKSLMPVYLIGSGIFMMSLGQIAVLWPAVRASQVPPALAIPGSQIT